MHVSRSGYTGEDGFEISVRADQAVELWDMLSADRDVTPIGLGARDSLRLEAGSASMATTSTRPPRRSRRGSPGRSRSGGAPRAAFPAPRASSKELAEGPARLRVGLLPEGKAPAREGAEIVDLEDQPIGMVTSGGFGPTLGGPVAMGYVNRRFAEPATPVKLMVRGKPLPARVVPLPFVPHRYVRGV